MEAYIVKNRNNKVKKTFLEIFFLLKLHETRVNKVVMLSHLFFYFTTHALPFCIVTVRSDLGRNYSNLTLLALRIGSET